MMVAPHIECEDVWKVFGTHPNSVLERIRHERLDKDAAQARFGAVIGVAGASFTVNRGEILCIMGLSGSGKSTLLRHIDRKSVV